MSTATLDRSITERCVDAPQVHRDRQALTCRRAGRRSVDNDLVLAGNVGTTLDSANVRRGFQRIATGRARYPAYGGGPNSVTASCPCSTDEIARPVGAHRVDRRSPDRLPQAAPTCHRRRRSGDGSRLCRPGALSLSSSLTWVGGTGERPGPVLGEKRLTGRFVVGDNGIEPVPSDPLTGPFGTRSRTAGVGEENAFAEVAGDLS